jgi:hypothetical protein
LAIRGLKQREIDVWGATIGYEDENIDDARRYGYGDNAHAAFWLEGSVICAVKGFRVRVNGASTFRGY